MIFWWGVEFTSTIAFFCGSKEKQLYIVPLRNAEPTRRAKEKKISAEEKRINSFVNKAIKTFL